MGNWMNRQNPNRAIFSIGTVAAAADTTNMLFCLDQPVAIVSASYVTSAAVVSDSTSGEIYSLVNKGTAGTGYTTVGTIHIGTATVGTLAACIPSTFALTGSLTTIPANATLLLYKWTQGTGTLIAPASLVVEYIDL
jgi:hypothetical protein